MGNTKIVKTSSIKFKVCPNGVLNHKIQPLQRRWETKLGEPFAREREINRFEDRATMQKGLNGIHRVNVELQDL